MSNMHQSRSEKEKPIKDKIQLSDGDYFDGDDTAGDGRKEGKAYIPKRRIVHFGRVIHFVNRKLTFNFFLHGPL